MSDADCGSELNSRAGRRSYIVMYSQADRIKFPTRQSFADAIVDAFSQGSSKAAVKNWVCCEEQHQVEQGGFHFHMAILLSGNKRWLAAKRFLLHAHGISVHFADKMHHNYYSAYKYVTKEDSNALHSPGHPDLSSGRSPRTSKSSKMRAGSSRSREEHSGLVISGPSSLPKAQRLSNFDVAELVVKENIKEDVALLALAKEQKDLGKVDLANFVLGKPAKCRNELIKSVWKMQNASAIISRNTMSRMAIVREALLEPCAHLCGGLWLNCAREVSRNNGVNVFSFADPVRELLTKGRGKHRNIMIVGPANCGKTFMLDPLNDMFRVFTNPASTSYAWLGAENVDVIFLNDFRYSQEILAWQDMLLLLEGQTIHFAAPKSTYAKDIMFDRDTPIFATGKEQIRYPGRYNSTDERENEMMDCRWRYFNFHWQIEERDVRVIPKCKRCFAELLMLGSDA